jgi:hypothetical protein
LLDGLLVALRCAQRRLLRAALPSLQQFADMAWVVAHAELALDERCHAFTRPYLADEAVRRSSIIKPRQDLGTLLGRKLARRPGGAALVQRRNTTAFTSATHPLQNRARRHTQRLSDLRLCPASLVQFPGTQPPAFTPVDGPTRKQLSHAGLLGKSDGVEQFTRRSVIM